MSEKRNEAEVLLYANLDELMAIDDGLKDLYLKRQGLETNYVHLNDQILNLDLKMIDQVQYIEYRSNAFSGMIEKFALNRNRSEYKELVKQKESIQTEYKEVNQQLETRLDAAYEQEFGLKQSVREAVDKYTEKKRTNKSTLFSDRVEQAQAAQKSMKQNTEVKEAAKTMK